uniref:C-type lectin domain-containing protein n=1 Tax=Pygocentrus nattereri TaxID=42514 RepID=A0A3B4E9J7_PYGNA
KVGQPVALFHNQTITLYICLLADPDGCLMSSAVLDVSNLSISWQASRQYCVDKGTQLASPSWANAHYYLTQKLTEVGASGQAWIGLRRHLLTREWYWQNGQGLDFSNWERGQPVIPEKGMCASMRMEPNGNYTWSSVQCCSSLKLIA